MSDPAIRWYAVILCDLCVSGEGGECHVPGCALWMTRAPDMPIQIGGRCQPMREPPPCYACKGRGALGQCDEYHGHKVDADWCDLTRCEECS